jgi:hypothetical protein
MLDPARIDDDVGTDPVGGAAGAGVAGFSPFGAAFGAAIGGGVGVEAATPFPLDFRPERRSINDMV